MKNRRRIAVAFTLLFALVLFLGICSAAMAGEHAKETMKHGNGHKLVILHTNDIHGHLVPFREKKMLADKDMAGMAYLAALVEKYKKDNAGHVLLLDAGDMAQGTPISNIFKGEPMIEVMNLMGYDAATIGNHEFDWRQPALENMIKKANFPFVCANVVYKDKPEKIAFGLKPYLIKKVGDMKVGILGLTTTETPTITKAENTKGLVFLDPAKTAKKYIPLMKKDGADYIIALTHQGVDDDKKLAEAVPEINLIVGGHSHTTLKEPLKLGETLIVQTGKYGLNLGKMEVRYCMHGKKYAKFTEKEALIPVFHDGITPDEKVVKIIARYEEEIAPIMKKVIGKTETDLLKKSGSKETGDWSMANLITDAMRTKAESDIALYNPGGVRSEIYKGEIKAEDIFTVLPFDNWLVTVTMKGKDVMGLLEHGAKSKGSAQISGMTFTIDYSKPAGSRIADAKVNGKPIDLEKDYTLTTIDFLYGGGDGFNFKASKDIKYGDHQRDVITEYIEKNTPLNITSDGRIKVENAEEEKSDY